MVAPARRPSMVPFALAAALLATAAAAGPRRVVLVVDGSRSMREAAFDPQLERAGAALTAGLGADDRVALVVVDTTARLLVPLSPAGDASVREKLSSELRALPFDGLRSDIPAGVERGLFELSQPLAGSTDAIVLVTDGRVDTGTAARDAERSAWLRESLVPEAKRAGVLLMGVGIGPAADYQLMQEMQSATGGRYARADSAEGLAKFLGETPSALDAAATSRATAAREEAERGERERKSAEAARARLASPPPAAPESRLPWLLAALALVVALAIAMVLLMRRRGGGEAGALAPESAPPPGSFLRQVSSGHLVPLEKAITMVGRDADNDLVIPLMTVTRNHAKIRFREGSFYLEDLRSTNGTWINGERLHGETVLCDGDELRFDKDRYVFERQFDGDKTNVIADGDRTVMRADRASGGAAPAAAQASWPRPVSPGGPPPRD